MRTWTGLGIGALATMFLQCGCADTSVEPHEQRVVQDASPDAVLAAAAALLQREFGRISIDRQGRRIETMPVEYISRSESGTGRDLYRGSSTMRRKATFNVSSVGGATTARLRVDIERRDTERQSLMQPRAYRLGDTPGQETPIDADAATTSEQNVVWTKVRRDRKLERALLDELREQFARLATDEASLARPVAPVTSAPDSPK